MKTLMMAILISLSFLGITYAAYSQKTGEAQTVIVAELEKQKITPKAQPED